MSNDAPNGEIKFADNNVLVTPGVITYTAHTGEKRQFYFQCNPASLTRSRTVTRTDTKAGTPTMGTTHERGAAGKKFTHRPSTWRFDSIEIWIDASNPPCIASTPAPQPAGKPPRIAASWAVAPLPTAYKREQPKKFSEAMQAVMEAIKHLEAICEPGPVPTENEHQQGMPPLPDAPRVVLWVGERAWAGYVTSVTILEKEFTHDLAPRLVKATLSLELVPTTYDLEKGNLGGAL